MRHIVTLSAPILFLLAACAQQPPAPVYQGTQRVESQTETGVAASGLPDDETGPSLEGVTTTSLPEAIPDPGDARIVGLLLPFNDARPRERALAHALRDAAMLALEDLGDVGLELTVHDTSGGAAAAAEQAIREGAQLLIGPLFARSVRETGEVARKYGIKVLAFSTDSSVAGDSVYLIGSMPDQEFERVLAFALERGHRQLAALIPETPYGDAAIFALERTLESVSAETPLILTYQKGFETASAAATEYAAERKRRERLDPLSTATALLLPESGSDLQAVIAFLMHHGVSSEEVQFLGSGVWDTPITLREEGLHGGWFAAPSPKLRAAFTERFRNRYDVAPPALAALAYDAVAVAGLLASTAEDDPFSAQAITSPAGFAGITGIFRFRPDGVNERALAVLEIQEGGFRVLDRASSSFTGF